MSNYIDGPTCVVLYCPICNRVVNKSIRGRKKTCSDECAKLYQRQVWNRQYAEKMAADPLYAQKQSARQYARIKADPDKMEAKRIAQNARMQLPNYKESSKKSHKKYRSDPENKERIAQSMRRYRDKNPQIISEIERRRIAKRSQQREDLRLNHPDEYEKLLQSEREAAQKRKSEQRLAELQKELLGMVNKDE